ncbi:HepT-like ribonuclease domain-containing protein [Homoserinimonas sp. A520]
MSRSTQERFADILAAIDRCLSYQPHLGDAEPQVASMAYDAVLRNLAVIGEAVRALPDAEKAAISGVPWASIAGLRNIVIHEYFRVEPNLITDILDNELRPLAEALRGRAGG